MALETSCTRSAPPNALAVRVSRRTHSLTTLWARRTRRRGVVVVVDVVVVVSVATIVLMALVEFTNCAVVTINTNADADNTATNRSQLERIFHSNAAAVGDNVAVGGGVVDVGASSSSSSAIAEQRNLDADNYALRGSSRAAWQTFQAATAQQQDKYGKTVRKKEHHHHPPFNFTARESDDGDENDVDNDNEKRRLIADDGRQRRRRQQHQRFGIIQNDAVQQLPSVQRLSSTQEQSSFVSAQRSTADRRQERRRPRRRRRRGSEAARTSGGRPIVKRDVYPGVQCAVTLTPATNRSVCVTGAVPAEGSLAPVPPTTTASRDVDDERTMMQATNRTTPIPIAAAAAAGHEFKGSTTNSSIDSSASKTQTAASTPVHQTGPPAAATVQRPPQRLPYRAPVDPNDGRTIVTILGLFELSLAGGRRMRPDGRSELAAAQLAVRHINEQRVLPGYRLALVTNDTQVSGV